jgi:hypothetical protein
MEEDKFLYVRVLIGIYENTRTSLPLYTERRKRNWSSKE